VTATPAPSTTTQRARAFVTERLPIARALGREAGDRVQDPRTAVDVLLAGLRGLADPEYLEGQRRVAPGIGTILGVRQPLLAAVSGGLKATTRRDHADTLLDLAARLVAEEPVELHWLADDVLARTIATEPERTWQLVRAEARDATDWITVDTLAKVSARGILIEPYRWAELEQLVYSPSRWERRLVGSTIATLPFADRELGRDPDVARRGLTILRDLVGDDEPDVQKSISWALRSLMLVDAHATTDFLRAAARTAAAHDDGYRAWVVRDALEKVDPATAAELRATVDGIRRRPGAPSTSRAAETARAFVDMGVDVQPSDRWVVPRGPQ
jgi:3-methyladenine DNA glycosylase AlkD